MNRPTYEKRREALRPKLAQAGLAALLVSHAANRYYLSGFELHDPQCNESSGCLLITRDGPDYLLTDPRFQDVARGLWEPEHVHIYTPPRLENILAFLKGLVSGPLGVEAQALDAQTYLFLAEGLEVSPVKNLVESLRIIKEPAEVELLRASCALNHKVFAQAEELLVPGVTEAQIAWELEKLFREDGASGMSFDTIVGVGPNAALPHAIPGETKVAEGQPVLIDMGCRLGAYCSDQTRTFWVGDKPSQRFADTLAQVREAQEQAIKAIRPGLPQGDAYMVARKHFEKLGVAELFTHGLGHGIGLETHEPPSLSPRADGELAPGMVVTVEPGLYDPAWGGVRWEYMVLVTEDGAEIL